MANLYIPNDPTVPNAKIAVTLGGTQYQVTLRVNTRVNRYYIDLEDSAGNMLISSQKILTNYPLYLSLAYKDGMPTPLLWPASLGASTDPPGYEELGEGARVQISVFT